MKLYNMLNLRKLINLLPYYYRGADTYKNKDGKGIFERYLEIFGNYFEDQIVDDTSTLTDILDIDTCDELYLNHFWEFLGQMPFAQGLHIDIDKWKIYFDGFKYKKENAADFHGKLMKTFQDSFIVQNTNTDYAGKNSKVHGDDQDYAGIDNIFDEVKSWKGACIVPTNSSLYFNPDNETVRALIKYSISLFKIRGTKQFFEILFRIYGLVCEIGEPKTEIFGDDPENVDYAGKDTDYAGKNSKVHGDDQDYAGIGQDMYINQYGNSKLDVEDSLLDDYTLDKFTTCTRCVTLPVNITGHTYKGINEKGFDSFRIACENIFDRFLPFNVKANINYGFIIPKIYTISTYIWDGTKWSFILNSNGFRNSEIIKELYLQDSIRTNLKIKVTIASSYKDSIEPKFIIGSEVDGQEIYGETKHSSEYIFNVTRATSYIIKSVYANTYGSNRYSKVVLDITRKSSIKYYNIGYLASTLNISKDNTSVSIELTGTVSFNGVIHPVNIRRMDTGEILVVDKLGKYTFITKEEGVYTFSLVDYPIRKITIVVTKDPEILDVTTNPTTAHISNGYSVSTVLNVQGSYHQEDVLAIQVKDASGRIVPIEELKNNFFVNDPDYLISENKILSHDYAMASIPLYNRETYEDDLKRITQVRFCCIKNPIRETSQWVNHRKYKADKDPLSGELKTTNIFTNILPNISMKDGYIDQEGNIINSSEWQHSDWVDVSKYAGGSSYIGPTDRLELWLICSHLTCYEVNNKEILYNCGEFFSTNKSGYFIFEATNNRELGKQASFIVSSDLVEGVSYYLQLSSQYLTYPYDGDQVNLLITISTNLSAYKGNQLDGSLNFGFVLEKYDKNSETWIMQSQVLSDDPKWVIVDLSVYTKRYSLVLNKATNGFGDFRIRSLDNAFYLKTFTVSDYVDPEKAYLYFEPENSLDLGWLTPENWGTASITDPNNSPAKAKWDLLKGTPKFKIRLLNGSTDNLNDIVLYSVNKEGIETLVGNNYQLNEVISNLNIEGTYRFKVKDTSTIAYAEITLVKNIIFKINCTPVIAIIKDGFATTNVIGTCNDPDINPHKLQVKRVGDTIWYDSPYQFIGRTTGTYNFTLRGNETGDEPVASFQIISSEDFSVAPTSLQWEAEDTSAQNLDIVTDSENSWEVTIEDS